MWIFLINHIDSTKIYFYTSILVHRKQPDTSSSQKMKKLGFERSIFLSYGLGWYKKQFIKCRKKDERETKKDSFEKGKKGKLIESKQKFDIIGRIIFIVRMKLQWFIPIFTYYEIPNKHLLINTLCIFLILHTNIALKMKTTFFKQTLVFRLKCFLMLSRRNRRFL